MNFFILFGLECAKVNIIILLEEKVEHKMITTCRKLVSPLFGCPCGVGVGRSRSATKKTALLRLSRCGGRCYCSQAAESVTAFKVVIIDEQITGKGGIIEVRLQKLGCALQHAAIIYKLFGIFFFA